MPTEIEWHPGGLDRIRCCSCHKHFSLAFIIQIDGQTRGICGPCRELWKEGWLDLIQLVTEAVDAHPR